MKSSKKGHWRKCGSTGREMELTKVWEMIKIMNGSKREYGYPV